MCPVGTCAKVSEHIHFYLSTLIGAWWADHISSSPCSLQTSGVIWKPFRRRIRVFGAMVRPRCAFSTTSGIPAATLPTFAVSTFAAAADGELREALGKAPSHDTVVKRVIKKAMCGSVRSWRRGRRPPPTGRHGSWQKKARGGKRSKGLLLPFKIDTNSFTVTSDKNFSRRMTSF